MTKNVLFFALGGHISSQNASFKRLAEILEQEDYSVFGAKDGSGCFRTGGV